MSWYLQDLAKNMEKHLHGYSPLAYSDGIVVIPGSKNAEHIKDNMDIFDFALTDEEMEQIAKLDKNERYYHRTDEQLVQFGKLETRV